MSLRTFLKPLSFLPALILMYMIYSFSAQEASVSSDLSYKVSYYMVKTADEVLDTNLQEWEIESFANRFHGLTRKLAHMTEYFALAIAVSFPLYVYGLHGIPLMLAAGMICVAYACGDEFHQSFVAGRSPSKRDVLIDSFGIFWGIILVRIIGWAGRKTLFRPRRRKEADAFPSSVYPPPEAADKNRRVSSYYNTVQQQSVPYNAHPRKMTPRQAESYGSYPYGNAPRGISHPEYSPRPQQYPRNLETPVRGSDKLSEDLSFRKLVRDIKEQHLHNHSDK